MRAVSTSTAIGLALWFVALPSQAVGFGRVSNTTQLGQPLNFAASVRLDPDETLSRECVSAEVQSGDNKLQPQLVRITLEGGADSADRSIRVTTSTLIDEPVVTVSVTIGCNAKVTRRFVAFVDPPLIDTPRTAQIEPPLPAQRSADSQVAPIVSAAQGGGDSFPASAPPVPDRARQPQRQRSVAAREPAAVDRAPVPPRAVHRQAAAVAHRAHVARAAASGPRLQLDSTPEVLAPIVASASAPAAASAAAVAPPASVASAMVAGAAASMLATAASSAFPTPVASVPDTSAADRQRIQSLESDMARMRAQSQSTQAAVAALQARLAQAESDRYGNPVVYALAFLSALLAIALAAFWWRQSRGRPAAQWWAGEPAPAAPSVRLTPIPEPVVAAPQPVSAASPLVDAFDVSTVVEDEAAVPPSQVSFSTRPAPFVTSRSTPDTLAPEPPRELSVEELIDLEQQAEFFIVLGQDDAAIELLMSHVRSDGGISPLPYLKLLEIYRRRGEDEAYQRIRERFNRRFNAYAPDWEADLQQGRSLEDYPETIVRLQALWSSPVRVMETLDASLFRRNRTDETFDLPAYRELLFLYSVARDLAEHAGVLSATSVDLLLPLDDLGEEPIARLSANTQTGDFQNSDMMTMPLDLDVSFVPSYPADAETVPSALRRSEENPPAGDSNYIDFDLDAPYVAPKVGGKS